jgi:periplasmic protein TonB
VHEPDRTVHLLWPREPGPGGGGGGGGDNRSEPPQRLKLRGSDALSVPATRPRSIERSAARPVEPDGVHRPVIPVVPLASTTELLPGAIEAPDAPPTGSRGPGTGDGAGSGVGGGDGPGAGPGFRSGRDGGTGGDVYRPGNGVTMPVEIRKGAPQYTTAAMRARVQGSITVECIVQPSGTCTDIHVKRSIEPAFGLDEEAIKAAAQWRFRPGLRRGQPVPVLVTIQIDFALR